MKFELSEYALIALQFLGWICTVGGLVAAALNIGGRYGAHAGPFWLTIAGLGLAGAIAATLGRVQIQSLNELEEIKKLLREQMYKRD